MINYSALVLTLNFKVFDRFYICPSGERYIFLSLVWGQERGRDEVMGYTCRGACVAYNFVELVISFHFWWLFLDKHFYQLSILLALKTAIEGLAER